MSEEATLMTLAGALVVIYLVLVVWLMRRAASLLAIPFTKAEDFDSIAQHEAEYVDGVMVDFRAVSQADMKFRYFFFPIVLPATLYIHYRFHEEILAGFQWTFERLGPMLISVFYAG